MSSYDVTRHKVVGHEEWVAARRALLAEEKELSRRRDALSQARRDLPWERVTKAYGFEGPAGKVSLADLFAGRSQLIVYHFMFGPGWDEGCKSCSYIADTFDGITAHLQARDVSFVAVSRAPLAEFAPFKRRMAWRFDWVSSAGGDFNMDHGVSFPPAAKTGGEIDYNYGRLKLEMEEMPGLSVFYKNPAGEIFHTYSCYARGLDMLLAAYHHLDLVPKGRDEASLPWSMAWVKHHDKY